MIADKYFNNETIRKTVAVFGSLFNSIHIGKMMSGKLNNVFRVPLSYGPRERFLVRIRNASNAANADVAIKLPRMSFEITSLSYDSAGKLNRNNVKTFPVEGTTNERVKVRQGVSYILGMQLSILADTQDSALQILEQILPSFDPEYTVSVKDMEGPGTLTDVPFILTGVSLNDEYEGDFESGRRSIIYTLDFNIKIKFIGSTKSKSKVIKRVVVDFTTGDPCDEDTIIEDRLTVEVGDMINDTPDNYTVKTTFGFDEP